MFELHLLVERLSRAVGVERVRVADLAERELLRLNLVLTMPLSESEGTVFDAICGVQFDFDVEVPHGFPCTSARASFGQA